MAGSPATSSTRRATAMLLPLLAASAGLISLAFARALDPNVVRHVGPGELNLRSASCTSMVMSWALDTGSGPPHNIDIVPDDSIFFIYVAEMNAQTSAGYLTPDDAALTLASTQFSGSAWKPTLVGDVEKVFYGADFNLDYTGKLDGKSETFLFGVRIQTPQRRVGPDSVEPILTPALLSPSSFRQALLCQERRVDSMTSFHALNAIP
jgi:hypothetical protein